MPLTPPAPEPRESLAQVADRAERDLHDRGSTRLLVDAIRAEPIATSCAVCGTSMVDEEGGRYVPLCSEGCEETYCNPPAERWQRPADEMSDDDPYADAVGGGA